MSAYSGREQIDGDATTPAGRVNGDELFHSGEKKEGPFARIFQGFVAWTFLLAVLAAFGLLVLMKVGF